MHSGNNCIDIYNTVLCKTAVYCLRLEVPGLNPAWITQFFRVVNLYMCITFPSCKIGYLRMYE